MKSLLILSILVGSQLAGAGTAQAQSAIVGRVVDAATNQPIPFATVYVNASTKGTTADADGNYRLPAIPAGTVDLVASAVGFKSGRQAIRLSDSKPSRVTFFLTPDARSLQTVTVTAKRTRAYERMIRTFKRELLGNVPFADKCLITNLRSVSLTESDGQLNAQATEPLVIENKALGYRLYYDMTHFDTFRQITHYAGTSRFEVMTPDNAGETERWERNRQKAYQGSIRHVLASLMAGTHEQEGFLVYRAQFDAPPDPSQPIAQITSKRSAAFAKADSLFRPTQLPSERQFLSNRPLEVFYTRKSVLSTPYRDMPYAYSIIYMPTGKAAIVTPDGWIVQPNGLEVRGAMSDDRLATLLPADWKPTGLSGPQTTPTEGTVLPADTLLASLVNQWSGRQKNTAPAVFLHLDKGVYATGDPLWFSGYVLAPDTHQPLVRTTADPENPVHVELTAPNGRLIQHQWARVKDGRTAGSFRLSDSLVTGTYRLRAYAEADSGNLRPAFERTVLIINGLSVHSGIKPPDSLRTSDSLDVQFLPEGGHWVAGLPSRMGIKALRQGKGVAVTGRIRTAQGTEAGRFATNTLGMGSLSVTPLPHQTYVAEIATGTGYSPVALPPVDSTGLVLATDMVTDSTQLLVQIQATGQPAGQPVYLTVQSRGQVQQQTKLQLLNGKATLSIPAAKLPVGVVQVTVFDAQGRPRAERLVFVPDRLAPIRAETVTDKATYQLRESMTVSLRVLDGYGDPLSIMGSASVTDAGQVAVDTSAATIQTHLLLTGDLRGPVEQPNQYLMSNRADSRRAVDNLLLTQGWRRINWPFSADQRPSATRPATGIRLTGQVFDKKNKLLPDASVLLTFTPRTGDSFARSARTDQQGHFWIDDLLLTDTVTVGTRVMTTAFKPIPAARVVLDAPGAYFATPDTLAPPDLLTTSFISAMQQRQASAPDQYRDRTVRQLQEVTVRAAKPADDSYARRVSLHGDADAVLLFDGKSRTFANAYEMMSGRVAGVQVLPKTLGQSGGISGGYTVVVRGVSSFSGANIPPLYILDGNYITENDEGTALLMINPNEIERIEVLKNSGTTAYGARGGSGVIAFFSKRPGAPKPGAGNPGEPAITLTGYLTEREFYTPRYTTPPDETANLPDRRDVLYWKPLLTTDGRGLTSFRFPLSDLARTIRITVQGITTDGRPVVINQLLNVR